jgi:excinuclease UvrABC ATPase subunit
VFTGVSGSGKSSLVFGTIAAESQRMINETYSAFVQGFMPTLARPDVDLLEGLTTAIIVDQERMGANSRSTVGTATDANAMLRVLFSRSASRTSARPRRSRSTSPRCAARARSPSTKGGGSKTGEARVRRHRRHVPALRGHGRSPTSTSRSSTTTPSRSTRARSRSPATRWTAGTAASSAAAASSTRQADPQDYTKKELHDLLYKEPTKIKVEGINLTYEGLIPRSRSRSCPRTSRRCSRTSAPSSSAPSPSPTCPECGGTRLNEAARSSKIAGINIAEACAMQISDLAEWVRGLDEPSVAPLLKGCRQTLDSFVEIGLGYLSPRPPSGTLSGGEAQRTKMIRHLGSSLTDVTYVFDEPTIGLHPHDIQRMNDLLLRLRDKGNTVLVVEHKPEAIAIADHVVDLGPGAGTAGGEVVFEGTVEGLRASGTLTGRHLDDRASLKPSVRKPRARSRSAAPPRTTSRTSTSTSRSACSPSSPASRLGQELAHPRLGRRPRRRGRRRPGAIKGLAAQQPGDLHRAARADPQGLRQGQRREARALQRQLRGRLPPATAPASSTPTWR